MRPNTEFFSGPYFPVLGLNTKYLSIFSPNAGRYEPEKTPYLDTFHAVIRLVTKIHALFYKHHFYKQHQAEIGKKSSKS